MKFPFSFAVKSLPQPSPDCGAWGLHWSQDVLNSRSRECQLFVALQHALGTMPGFSGVVQGSTCDQDNWLYLAHLTGAISQLSNAYVFLNRSLWQLHLRSESSRTASFRIFCIAEARSDTEDNLEVAGTATTAFFKPKSTCKRQNGSRRTILAVGGEE